MDLKPINSYRSRRMHIVAYSRGHPTTKKLSEVNRMAKSPTCRSIVRDEEIKAPKMWVIPLWNYNTAENSYLPSLAKPVKPLGKWALCEEKQTKRI